MKAKSGTPFFGAAPTIVPPLDSREIPDLVREKLERLPFNEHEKQLLTKIVTHWLSLVEGKVQPRQIGELLDFVQQGQGTVPGAHLQARNKGPAPAA
jgi:hypothetical protein